MAPYDDLIRYWFSDSANDAVAARDRAGLWWGKSPETDREIAARFGDLAREAATGALDRWAETPTGMLALVLLLDQMPRVIHRDTPEAFAQDESARSLVSRGIANGFDRTLRPLERLFFYLPLEHSENLADQDRAVGLFRRLEQEVPASARETFRGFTDYAERHRDVIRRFGRFPHRNRILGRTSTPEELDFLKQPGSSF
jgi:uncharacterized protein (DUF924 family)